MHNENIKMCFLLFSFIEFAYQPLNKNVWAPSSAAFTKDFLRRSGRQSKRKMKIARYKTDWLASE
jgi:hypothetical protein